MKDRGRRKRRKTQRARQWPKFVSWGSSSDFRRAYCKGKKIVVWRPLCPSEGLPRIAQRFNFNFGRRIPHCMSPEDTTLHYAAALNRSPTARKGKDSSSSGEQIPAHRRSGRRVAARNGRVARATHFQHTLCALKGLDADSDGRHPPKKHVVRPMPDSCSAAYWLMLCPPASQNPIPMY